MSAPAVVFDLDGVIADSAATIASCLRGALAALGLTPPAAEAIRPLIGPPIHEVVGILTGIEDAALLDACVAGYRERYFEQLAGTPPFPGMPEVIAGIDRPLALATSKPVELAGPILEALGLRDRFAVLEGSRLGERGVSKTEILARAVAALDGDAGAMVGDRRHDVEAARAHGLRAIGVTWGYGDEAELRAAGADVIVSTPAALAAALAS